MNYKPNTNLFQKNQLLLKNLDESQLKGTKQEEHNTQYRKSYHFLTNHIYYLRIHQETLAILLFFHHQVLSIPLDLDHK